VIELLVGMTLALVVFTAATALLIDGMRDQGTIETRSFQLQQAQSAMEQLVRNLREATSVAVTNSSTITYSLPVATGVETITFACSVPSDTCTNTTGGVQQTAVTGVTNTNIFTASPSTNSTYIGVMLSVAAQGQTAVTLTDGTGLRNVTLGK
jgi:Tfp pilus assembly protein PilW